MNWEEEKQMCRRIKILADAFVESQRYGQVSPQTLEEIKKISEEKE